MRDGSLLLASTGLAGGILASLGGADRAASAIWFATTMLGVVVATGWVGAQARRGRLGVDVIALAALVGTLLVDELFAGAVITVMLTTGRALEGWATGRAERELRALLAHGPALAHRYEHGQVVDRPLEAIAPGDVLLVRPGEVVPADGVVRSGTAVLDESTLTGESLPVQRGADSTVRSGVVNAGGPFDLDTLATPAESTFASIVRLVEESSATNSPFVRMADRFAGVFLVTSFAVAAAAGFAADDATRAVAVLVVATPCPLILAAPVAIVSGLSRCARRGVVVKGGAVLESLARAEVLRLDKTGTVTAGRPTLLDVVPAEGVEGDDVLRLAASLDQVSAHVLAAAIVHAARERNLPLQLPSGADERPGAGIEGRVADASVRVGNGAWVGITGREDWVTTARRRAEFDGAVCVFVAVDGVPAGAVLLVDPIRTDAARAVRNLRRSGIRRIVMVTGDRQEVAAAVGAMVGLDDVVAEQTPAGKVEVVRREMAGGSTIMVGDGVNDAPALAAADVGVALGARGSTASSEAADIVLTIDRLDRLGDAHLIAIRARSIAVQSVLAGMSLSLCAMIAAAFGLIPPPAGAVLQELIDLAVILNALRALRAGRDERYFDEPEASAVRTFALAHRSLRPSVGLLLAAADQLGAGTDAATMELVRRAHRWLVDDLGPHERSEDRVLYPMVADVLGGTDPTGTMSRAHAEIERFTGRLGVLLAQIGDGRPSATDVRELQRLLYGVHALLELHFAQEDESYLSMVDDSTDRPYRPAS